MASSLDRSWNDILMDLMADALQRLIGIVLASAKSSGVANGILGVDQADIFLAGALQLIVSD